AWPHTVGMLCNTVVLPCAYLLLLQGAVGAPVVTSLSNGPARYLGAHPSCLAGEIATLACHDSLSARCAVLLALLDGVTSCASMRDTQGIRRLLARLKCLVPELETIWAEAACRGKELADRYKAHGKCALDRGRVHICRASKAPEGGTCPSMAFAQPTH